MLWIALLAAVAADQSADEKALTTLKTTTWPGYYRAQDVEGLDAYLDDDFVNVAPDGTVTPKADELDWVANNAWNPTNFRYRVNRFDWFSDDLVQVTGTGTSLRSNQAGEPCEHSYISTNLVRRDATSPVGWKALSSHVSGLSCKVIASDD